MNLLVALPIWADNCAQAEQLLDYIFQLSARRASGHVLLALGTDVHGEMRERLKISAGLAFAGVHEIEIRPLADKSLPKWSHIRSVFQQVATEIESNFKWPFLWMEPDCVPVRRHWLQDIERAYDLQPRPYFGTRMRVDNAASPDKSTFFMARVGIYPNQIPRPEAGLPTNLPIEFQLARNIMPKFTATKLIQQTMILLGEDLVKVRADAGLVHGDKQGILLQHSIANLNQSPDAVSSENSTELETQEFERPVNIPITGLATSDKVRRKRRTKLEMIEARKNGEL